MKTKIETYLPIFPGFYNTLFEPEVTDEIFDINQTRRDKNLPEIDYDDCIFNYNQYQSDVSENCCDVIEEKLNEIIECKVTFQELISPKYYNYSNDHINVEIEIDLNEVEKYLLENIEYFDEYLRKNYTSCSGFISSYSNKPDVWLFKYLRDSDKLKHCLGSALNFMLQNEEYFCDNLYDDLMDWNPVYLHAENYEELTNN
jgi:hypothetical protein